MNTQDNNQIHYNTVRLEVTINTGNGPKIAGYSVRYPFHSYSAREEMDGVRIMMTNAILAMEDKVREGMGLPTRAEDARRYRAEDTRRRASEMFRATAGPLVVQLDDGHLHPSADDHLPLGEVRG